MVVDPVALSRLSVFGAMSESGIRFLIDRAEDVRLCAGETFFREGEMGDALFVLLEGSVEIARHAGTRKVTLAELESGCCFGEMALVAIRKRNATATARVDCRALRLRNMSLFELYQQDPEQFTLLQMNLSRDLARRLEKANDDLFESRVRECHDD